MPLPVSSVQLGGSHAASLLSQLNALDWAFLCTVTISTVLAFMRGLVRSLISLVGIAAGILFAAWYAPGAASYLRTWVPQPALAQTLAFLVIVCACYACFALLGGVLRSACKAVGLGMLDRLAGGAFGFARAVLLLSAVLIAAGPFLAGFPLVHDSVVLPYLRTAAHGVCFVLPRDFADRLLTGADFGTSQRQGHGGTLPGSYRSHSQFSRTAEGDAQ